MASSCFDLIIFVLERRGVNPFSVSDVQDLQKGLNGGLDFLNITLEQTYYPRGYANVLMYSDGFVLHI